MSICWASVLADGCTNQSSEHTITEALFLGDHILVQGFSWCMDHPKEIPARRFVKNILCVKHNGLLSRAADEPAVTAIRVFRECSDRGLEVRSEPLRRFPFRKHLIDGLGLERWLTKTLINVCFLECRLLGCEDSSQISPVLVQTAFGRRAFDGYAGLYLPVHVGAEIPQVEGFGIKLLLGGANEPYDEVVGGLFSFRGNRFLLWLDERVPPPALRKIGLGGEDWSRFNLMRHPARIKEPVSAQSITFQWKLSALPRKIPRRR